MSDEPNPSGPPKSGVATQQPRPADTTGTLSFSDPPDSGGGPPKSGVAIPADPDAKK
jgi:hypothetical protein